jgi:hypothetical protein
MALSKPENSTREVARANIELASPKPLTPDFCSMDRGLAIPSGERPIESHAGTLEFTNPDFE